MQKRTVLLDLDGVLCSFCDGALKAHGRPEKHDDIKQWNFFEAWGMTAQQFYDGIRGYDFWFNLEPYPWAVDMFRKIKERFPCVIATAPCEDEECASGKYAWLKKHLSVGVSDVMMGSKKHLMAHPLHILIDDSPSGIAAFQAAGGIALGFKQPWNKFDLTHKTIHEELDQYFIP